MTTTRLIFTFSIFFSIVTSFSGCAVVKGTGAVAWEATKISSKVAWEATKLAGKGVKTSVHMAIGRTVVPLRKEGNSMFVKARINRRITTELLLDTGAAFTQISSDLAARLGLNVSRGEVVMVRVADGRTVEARQVYLKELSIGRAVVRNMPVVVLREQEGKKHNGLLGMTFLNEFVFQIDSKKGELVLNKRMN